jgi:hypothetical protein
LSVNVWVAVAVATVNRVEVLSERIKENKEVLYALSILKVDPFAFKDSKMPVKATGESLKRMLESTGPVR